MGNDIKVEELLSQYEKLRHTNIDLMCTILNDQTINDPEGAILLTAAQIENVELKKLLTELIELELDESDRSFDEEDADKFSSVIERAKRLLKTLKENSIET